MSLHQNGLGLGRFVADSSFNIIRQIWMLLINIAISIILVRSLGQEGRGFYTMAILLPDMLYTFLNLGLGTAIVYFLGSQKHSVEEVIQENIYVLSILTFFGVGIGFGIAYWAGDLLFPDIAKEYLLLGLLIYPLQLLTAFLVAIFQGKQDFRNYNLPTMVSGLMMLLLSVIFVWLMKLGIFGAILGNIISKSTGLLFLIISIIKTYKPKLKLLSKIRYDSFKQFFRYGMTAQVANSIAYINYRADYFLLNSIKGAASVGIYSVAVELAEKLWGPTSAITLVLLPRIASLENNTDQQIQLTAFVSRVVVWVSLILTLVSLGFSELVIGYLYTDEFSGSILPFRIILLGIMSLNLTKLLGSDIAGRGKPEVNLKIALTAAITNVTFNLILIPIWGIPGAAASSSISYTVQTIISLAWYHKTYQVPIRAFFIFTKADLIMLADVSKRFLKKSLPRTDKLDI